MSLKSKLLSWVFGDFDPAILDIANWKVTNKEDSLKRRIKSDAELLFFIVDEGRQVDTALRLWEDVSYRFDLWYDPNATALRRFVKQREFYFIFNGKLYYVLGELRGLVHYEKQTSQTLDFKDEPKVVMGGLRVKLLKYILTKQIQNGAIVEKANAAGPYSTTEQMEVRKEQANQLRYQNNASYNLRWGTTLPTNEEEDRRESSTDRELGENQ